MKKTVSVCLVIAALTMISSCSDSSGEEEKEQSLCSILLAKEGDHEKNLVGQGTEEEPFILCLPNHLNLINENLDAHYAMGGDIDLKNQEFTPIEGPFEGYLDGNGQKIKNLSITMDGSDAGLFLEVGSNGSIHHLGIENFHIEVNNATNDTLIGAMVALNFGTITNSYAIDLDDDVDIIGDAFALGGLIGYTEGESVKVLTSYANSSIMGGANINHIGGLVGIHDGGKIISSSSTSIINGEDGDDKLGGLVGAVQGGAGIISSYIESSSLLTIAGGKGNDTIGGLLGYLNGYIVSSYVGNSALSGGSGDDQVGGLVGSRSSSSERIISSYALGQISGQEGSDQIGVLLGKNDGNSSILESYGFGILDDTTEANILGSPPEGVSSAFGLTLDNTNNIWSLDAWDFGKPLHIPILKYVDDYNGAESTYVCTPSPRIQCGSTILPRQNRSIKIPQQPQIIYPSAPLNLNIAIDSLGTQATLSWTPPENKGLSSITGYKIELKDANGPWFAVEDNTQSTATGQIVEYSFAVYRSYYFRVTAMNAHGIGTPSSDGLASLLAAPDVVTDLSALINSAGTRVDINWNPPVHDGGFRVVAYQVEIKKNNGGDWQTIDRVAHDTSTSDSFDGNFELDSSYFIKVSAINEIGVGVEAEVVASKDPLPNAPTGLTAWINPEGSRVNLNWTAPSWLGEPRLEGYRVQMKTDDGPWEDLIVDTGSASNEAIKDVVFSDSSTYKFQVAGVVSGGNAGLYSDEVTADWFNYPSAPTDFFASMNTRDVATTAQLSWTVPGDDGGSPITGYSFEFKQLADSSSWTPLSSSAIQMTSTNTAKITYNFVDADSSSYVFRIIANNIAGGENPAEVNVLRPPSEPTLNYIAVKTPGQQNDVEISWDAPSDESSSVTGYRIQIRGGLTGNWVNVVVNTNSASTTHTYSTSTNGNYYFQVAAINVAGVGPFSTAVKATTPLGKTTLDSVVAATPGENDDVTLSWTAPSDEESSLTGYKIQKRSGSTGSWVDVVADTGSTETTYTYQDNIDGDYYFQVAAINVAGLGTYSDAVQVASVPGEITEATVRLTSFDKILNVSWTAPDNGGLPITKYEIRRKKDDGDWRLNKTVTTTSGSWTESHKFAIGTHYVQIRAENEVGWGPWSTGTFSATRSY